MLSDITQGEQLFNHGDFQQAQEFFEAVLAREPDHADALNDLGAVHFARGDLGAAEGLFRQSLEIRPDCRETLLNLAEIYAKQGHCRNELEMLERLSELGFKADWLNKRLTQLGPCSTGEGGPSRQQVPVAQPPARPATARPKLLFLEQLGVSHGFLSHVIDQLERDYEVCYLKPKNDREVRQKAAWADLIWLEWANELAVHVTRKVDEILGKPVICRIHSYEVFAGYLQHIDWSRVNKAIFVSDHTRRLALQQFPAMADQTHTLVIHNGLRHLDRFAFAERRPGFNLAVVGSVNHKKNPALWPEVASRLAKIDPRYTIKVAGEFQDLREKLYLENMLAKLGLEGNLRFFGRVDDIPGWFEEQEINYLLTTTLFESFGYGIAEAMAMGYKPLINSYPGAEEMWPRRCLFRDVDELIGLLTEQDDYDSRYYRRFVVERYAEDMQIQPTKALLRELLTKGAKAAVKPPARPTPAVSQVATPAPAKTPAPTNLIVTGIPRSGTSLLSVLINHIPNAVCLNEILYDVASLPQAFAEVRSRLAKGLPIPNKYETRGGLTTETQGRKVEVIERPVKDVDGNGLIGSKVNIPYLNHLPAILRMGFKVVAIVRDPVFTLASWNSPKAATIPEAHVTPGDCHPRWQGFPFDSEDKLARQAQLWEFYAKLIWDHRDRIELIHYEQLTERTEEVLADLCRQLGSQGPRELPELKNMNDPGRFADLTDIQRIVRRYCPTALKHGYGGTSSRQARTPDQTPSRYDTKTYWRQRAGASISPNSGNLEAQRRHLEYVGAMVDQYQPGKLLDFGVGVGRLFGSYARVPDLAACDITPKYLEFSRQKAASMGLDIQFQLCQEVNQTPYHDKQFDLVLAISVLLHQRPEEVESVMRELVRIGKRIVVITLFEPEAKKDSSTNGSWFYNHDYEAICRRNKWLMEDVRQTENQILFTLAEPLPRQRGQVRISPNKGMAATDEQGPACDYDQIENYCMFLGYPRSGHSLIGALLDAHPEMVIAHELDALQYIDKGIACRELFQLIVQRSLQFSQAGNEWTGYSYAVPGQWQGRWRDLKVIGDKKGGRSTMALMSRPDLLDRLMQTVARPVKLLHVIRNPFDNISTISLKDMGGSVRRAIDFYIGLAQKNRQIKQGMAPGQMLDVYLDKFIAEPASQLARICEFLGVEANEEYLLACAGIVFASPRKTRSEAAWDGELEKQAIEKFREIDFLAPYWDAQL